MVREIEIWFPTLLSYAYEVTSERTPRYNCVAFAVDDYEHWWDGSGEAGTVWPTTVPRDDTLAAWVQFFQLHGFESCESGEPEAGFEKLAIYVDDEEGLASHVAKQTPSGTWSSKLGEWEDIEHESLLALSRYGTVAQFMRRPSPQT